VDFCIPLRRGIAVRAQRDFAQIARLESGAKIDQDGIRLNPSDRMEGLAQQDVFRLDIVMQNAVCVKYLQPRGHGGDDRQRVALPQPVLGKCVKNMLEVTPPDILHHQIIEGASIRKAVTAYQRRTIVPSARRLPANDDVYTQARDFAHELCFLVEEVLVGSLGNFECDAPARWPRDVLGEIDMPVAATADWLADNAKATDPVSGLYEALMGRNRRGRGSHCLGPAAEGPAKPTGCRPRPRALDAYVASQRSHVSTGLVA